MTNLPDGHATNAPREEADQNSTRTRNEKTIAVRFPADVWRQLVAAFADTPDLAAELARLRNQVAAAKLDRANLAAAALATIAAHGDGECDPLSYLRDELNAQGFSINRTSR